MPHPQPPGRSRSLARSLPSFAGLLLPLAASGVAAGLMDGIVLGAWILVAETLAITGAACEAALSRYSRASALEIAAETGRREMAERELAHYGAHLLDARLLRFLGNALLVAGVAFLVFREGRFAPSGSVPWTGVGLVLAITFVVAFLVNEVVVDLLSRRDPDRMVLGALPLLGVLRHALAPIRWPLVLLVRLLFRVRLGDDAKAARQEVLESVEEGEREGSLTRTEADMIESIMDMGASVVKDVMTGRAEMVMIQADAPVHEGITLINEHSVSRVPVFGEDRDEVVGVLYARDLISHWRDPRAREDGDTELLRVQSVMRSSPFFVPETKAAGDLLAEMQAKRIHLAIVVDEFGGTTGLVTIEDLLEEIVGEIRDEYDEDEVDADDASDPDAAAATTLEVDGRTPIEDVNRAFAIELPVEEDFETIGGLVFHHLGNVPQPGDRVELPDVHLLVLDADERTVKRLRVLRA